MTIEFTAEQLTLQATVRDFADSVVAPAAYEYDTKRELPYDIIATMGQKEKFPLPVASTALQMFLATAAAGMGRDDDASPARLIAQITGIALPPAKTN